MKFFSLALAMCLGFVCVNLASATDGCGLIRSSCGQRQVVRQVIVQPQVIQQRVIRQQAVHPRIVQQNVIVRRQAFVPRSFQRNVTVVRRGLLFPRVQVFRSRSFRRGH